MIERPGAAAPAPDLSVVVTVVDGGAALHGLLGALRGQESPPAFEVILPVDDSVPGVGEAAAAFPEVRILRLGPMATEHPADSPSGQHELYDRRRAAGLAAARGDVIAILEDRGHPDPDWARTAMRLHAASDAAVIGGAIEPEPAGLVNWAFWVCDFSRYGRPFPDGPAAWVSDVNVTYKRDALEATRPLWSARYHEPVVHWEIQRRGGRLELNQALVVRHRRAPTGLLALLPERFGWGRLFGAIRARHLSGPARVLRVVAAPLVPFVVLARHGRAQWRRGDGGRFLRAMPLLLAMLAAWTVGETWGTATGRG